LTKKDKEARSTIDGAELNYMTIAEKQFKLKEIDDRIEKANTYLKQQTDKEINSIILNDFYNELLEIERFVL